MGSLDSVSYTQVSVFDKKERPTSVFVKSVHNDPHKNATKTKVFENAIKKKRFKINGSFSSWQESIKGVPKGSVLGPLLLYVFINEFFFLVEETEICNYADDTTIYVCDHKLEYIASSLETDAQKPSKWFLDNSMNF